MAGERKEIAIEILNIDRHMRDALGCVYKSERSHTMRSCDDFFGRRNRTQHVGHLSESDELGLGG